MKLKQQLIDAGIKPEHMPTGYQIIGDVLLLKFPIGAKIKSSEKKTIAKAIAQLLPKVQTILETKKITGELRKPAATLLFFRSKKPQFETIHIENGIKFKLDTRKIMFSKGNVNERSRLISKIQPNETIVDMFAGIGYFSLPIAKNSKAAKIFAIEKNPVAFRYLKQNITLNNINNITPIKADCRRARIKEKADRVLMGYFPHTERFLPAAFKFLKPHAVIHYHNIYDEKDMRTKPVSELEKAAKAAGFKVIGFLHHVVKSYAPHVWHVVVDAEVEKQGAASKDFYDKTAEMYDLRQKNNWTSALRQAEIALLQKHARGSMLDIGCGTGFHLAWLQKNKPECKLTGCDISKTMLTEASKNVSCDLIECAVEHLPFADNTFDTVLCMFSTLNLCDYSKALAEMHRSLKPDGRAILTVSSIWDNDGKSEKRIRIEKEILRLHLFEANELKTEFERAGFRIVYFDSLFRSARPRWGDWQSAVKDDPTQPVERGAIYLYVLELTS